MTIEKLMNKIFKLQQEKAATSPAGASHSTGSGGGEHNPPAVPTAPAKPQTFAVINSVTTDSPAEVAGLQKGDRVAKFGQVTAKGPQRLQAIAKTVHDYMDDD